MSEPEPRHAHDTPAARTAPPARRSAMPERLAVVGAGRVGTALSAAFRAARVEVEGPLRRGEAPSAATVLLCVPDAEIGAAAKAVAERGRPRFIGHVSGATPLAALEPARRAGAELFTLHPLQTFSGEEAPRLAGVGCAVAGSSPASLSLARALAARLGGEPFEIDEGQRAGYHAAASIASNFLVTLEAAAEAVAADAGFDSAQARALLAPLVHQTVANWASGGAEAALTGPVARGDRRTVAAQRRAVATADAALLPLFDALVERTEALAARTSGRAPVGVAA